VKKKVQAKLQRLSRRMLSPTQILNNEENWAKRWWRASLINRIVALLVALLIFVTSGMYVVAQWYIAKHSNEPLKLGATFIPDYAEFLGVEPEETLDAMIHDLGIRQFRFVSYWKNGEPEPGNYDFSYLDWQFDKAQAVGAKVSLAIGLRQPRWPECHMPEWAIKMPQSDWEPRLMDYLATTVERYKDHPALESWQLENEYLLAVFGVCPDHTRERLVDEFNLVKQIDPKHPVIVSRSNNAVPSWPIGKPRADIIGASIYKRVWDGNVTNRYFEYPLPSWFYAFLAGGAEATTGRNTIIHELQAEAWLPPGYEMHSAPTQELYKSMSPELLRARFEYGVGTGVKTIDLWGVEWWYYMKEKRDAPELWDVAKEQFERYRTQ
jgi:hypothetical protein